MAGLTREELEKIIRLQTEEDTLPAEDLQSSLSNYKAKKKIQLYTHQAPENMTL